MAETNEHCRTLEQRVQELTETLAQTQTQLSQETERRKGVEAQWQQERAEAQVRHETQAQALTAEQGKLADRTHEWQVSQAAVAETNEHCRTLEQRVQELTETLAQTRTQLSQETERRKDIEAQWQQERAEAQVRYETQVQALTAEQGKLADKAQEWQASQAAVAETNEHCRTLEQRVQELTEALAQTRTQLLQETESRKGVEAQWQQERAEAQARYETQAQALTAEQGKLADKNAGMAGEPGGGGRDERTVPHPGATRAGVDRDAGPDADPVVAGDREAERVPRRNGSRSGRKRRCATRRRRRR